ncbi:hypothetical protein WAI453_006358 [Rhynchosporium graminicola]|uniref:Uncharacterized protein n=1 Tax=Rhynchosporium graminicola TaxID=2792576 RepID=A0A1E1LHX3_9HELO|nr:uncharacterized protein RCO7_03237 [Rhynchosporium commune]
MAIPQMPIILLLTPIFFVTFSPSVLPLPILRIVPLLSSTVSLIWAYDEYAFLTAWLLLPRTQHTQIQQLLPLWFAKWGPLGTKVLFSSFPLSVGAGVANIVSVSRTSGLGWEFFAYGLGTFFTLMHFIYGPKAMGLLKGIRTETKDGGDPLGQLEMWMRMHLQRCWVADGPATVAFGVAVILGMEG